MNLDAPQGCATSGRPRRLEDVEAAHLVTNPPCLASKRKQVIDTTFTTIEDLRLVAFFTLESKEDVSAFIVSWQQLLRRSGPETL